MPNTNITIPEPFHPDDEVVTTIDQELQQVRNQLASLYLVRRYEAAKVPESRINQRPKRGRRPATRPATVADFVFPPSSGVPRGRKLEEAIAAQELRRQILEEAKAEHEALSSAWFAWKDQQAKEIGGAVADALNEIDEYEAELEARSAAKA